MESSSNKTASSKEEMQVLADVALELQKGFKGLDYYSEGHPALNELLAKSFSSISKSLENKDKISLAVKRRGFFNGFHQIGKDFNPLADLARDFYIRGIRNIFLLNGLKQNDLNAFLRAAHHPPKILQERGGLDNILAEQGVGTVWVNEIKYGKLMGKDLNYRGETENVASQAIEETDNKKAANSDFSVKSEETNNEEEADEKDDSSKNIDLEEFIFELKGDPVKERLMQILGLVIPPAQEEVASGERELPLELLRVLSNLIDKPTNNSSGLDASILTTMREVASRPMITHLIERLCSKENALDTAPVLLKLGEASLDMLLDMMADTDDLRTRKHLTSAIQKFGRQAAKSICSRLSDDRWFVVRNLVALLGEVGAPEDIDYLEEILFHSDERVGKEVLRTLGRVGGFEGAALIVKSFDDINRSLNRTAVFSLGLLGEDIALPLMKKILNKKGMFAEDEELRLEAVATMGKLKSAEAVPDLETMLLSERLFQKESNSLRIAAAKSLMSISGREALEAIKKGTGVKSREVSEACEKFMKQIVKKTGDKS